MNIFRYVLIGLIFLSLNACDFSEQKTTEKLFTLLPSEQTNVHFINTLENKKLNILEYLYYYNGGGVATGDFNNDGLTDLYFTSNEGENKLYLNKGNFQFEDITDSAGVACSDEWSTGVTLVDINSDGFLDIYVCQVGNYKGLKGHNKLFVNNGDLTFTDQSEVYGLDFSGLSTQAVFFDFDQDDDLDMYLLNHSVHSTRSYGPSSLRQDMDMFAGDRLYLNLKDKGQKRFQNMARERGIYNSHIGYGLGVAVADINNDGWPDIYVSNDFHENDYLYINQKDGTFKESLEKMIAHTSRYSMGNDIGDLNGDALPEIITVDMLPYAPEVILKSAWEDSQEVSDIKKEYGYSEQNVRNTLQLNRGDYFTDIAPLIGMEATDWSWAPLICDLNNDSYPDVFITNGIYKRPNDLDYIQYTSDISKGQLENSNSKSLDIEMINRMPTLQIPNFAFMNLGNMKFENQTIELGLDQPSYSNGSAYADLDNDGDLDLVTSNVNQGAFIYRNNSQLTGSNNFLSIQLRGKENSIGIGAKVKVYAGNKIFLRENYLSRGFQSSISPSIHIGLGELSTVDSVEIFWKHNRRQVVKNVKVNSFITIEQADSSGFEQKIERNTFKEFFTLVAIDTSIRHIENIYKDYSAEPLIPYRLSQEGPALAVADVNNDGLEDYFLGGAKDQPAKLLLQSKSGKFIDKTPADIITDLNFEDVDAVFFDANGDGFQDLYVISGGGEYPEGNSLLEDRLYINDGTGNLERSKSLLPPLKFNGACVKPFDFNKDGAVDLFVGNRSVPGNYGRSPLSHFLFNDGQGNFKVHQTLEMGMVTDAEWFDINEDGVFEILAVGDWMPVSVYKYLNGKFVRDSSFASFENTHGWWRSLQVADVNGDGKKDVLAGNMGSNLRLKASIENPVRLYLNDFDDNGQGDPIVFYWLGGKYIPFHTKGQLAKQMPMVNKKFTSFNAFSSIETPNDLLPKDKLSSATQLKVTTFDNLIFINNGKGDFQLLKTPSELQYTSVRDWLVYDFNNDSIADVFCVGNILSNLIQLGQLDGQSQFLLIGKGKGDFDVNAISRQSDYSKEIKSIKKIRIGNRDAFIAAVHNESPQIFFLRN